MARYARSGVANSIKHPFLASAGRGCFDERDDDDRKCPDCEGYEDHERTGERASDWSVLRVGLGEGGVGFRRFGNISAGVSGAISFVFNA